ncbi:glycosyl hydrolase 108 family protein [Tenacibaculum maritimum]|nr:glycosyl hydrolase 108 family protein [Tenacibaculum maritimum]MDB0612645.1 glycosyl hydrolase 108 family protein [Tenacibaculum maritimum]
MANFDSYIVSVKSFEGGYQDRGDDPGNFNSRRELVGTNHGISAKTYQRWIGYPPSIEDMKNITLQIAQEIFKVWYWDKVNASSISSQEVAENIVDHAINAGVFSSAKIVQEVLNIHFNQSLQIDGIIGRRTIDAINKTPSKELLEELVSIDLVTIEKLEIKVGFLYGKEECFC